MRGLAQSQVLCERERSIPYTPEKGFGCRNPIGKIKEGTFHESLTPQNRISFFLLLPCVFSDFPSPTVLTAPSMGVDPLRLQTLQQVVSPHGESLGFFGRALVVDGAHLVVGPPRHTGGTDYYHGAAYFYTLEKTIGL
ncbi:MAG TPA: hypothetical protein VMT46_01520 [Anaerolineaceae bacterium]|nr:hypothetical protein [Anaerolineaceae bacterium]